MNVLKSIFSSFFFFAELFCHRATLYYVDKAVANFEKNPSIENNRELSVLEKLLKVDKNVALVMALDMFMAGVDTVRNKTMSILIKLKMIDAFKFIH